MLQMKITFGFSLLVLTVLRSSRQQCLSPSDNAQPDSHGRSSLYTGQQQFSFDFLKTINQLKPSESVFFSPYSTYHLLLTAYFLSGGKTENYLQNVLRLTSQNKPTWFAAFKLEKVQTRLEKINSSNEFYNIDKIYVDENVEVRSCVLHLFDEEISTAPFKTDPEGSRFTIDKWVAEQTNNMIKDLLPPNSIDSTSTLLLVSAAYFKGKWKNIFNPRETKTEVFYVSLVKQILVPMMHVEGTFNHGVSERLSAHILEMPYEGDHMSMYVFLPPYTRKDAIDDTLKILSEEKFQILIDNSHMSVKTVKVSFPKFSLEQTTELIPVLERLGGGSLFKTGSNFSTLSPNVVSADGLHKAKIVIDEQSSQQGVLKESTESGNESKKPTIFSCNRPFIFVIFNKFTRHIMFAGVFKKPASNYNFNVSLLLPTHFEN